MRSIKDNSWEFFENASGTDIYEASKALELSGIDGPSTLYSPQAILDCIFIHRYGEAKRVSYERFIQDLFYDLDISNGSGIDGLSEKEDAILLSILTRTVKSLDDDQLAQFREALGLTNTSRDAIVREMSAKAATSDQFRKILPVISCSMLGLGTDLTLFTSLGVGYFTVSRILGAFVPLAGLFGVTIWSAISLLGKHNKRKAEKILPAVVVLIRIRRDYYTTFNSAKNAIDYVKALLQTSSSDLEKYAIAMLVSILRADNTYEERNIGDLDRVEAMSGFHADDTVPDRKREVLKPYYKNVEDYLCSFIKGKGDHMKVIEILFPHDQFDGCDHELKQSVSTLETVEKETDREEVFSSPRFVELEKRVGQLERILHGIRHNLAPDFANAMNPYREFMEDPSVPITLEEAKQAERIGSRIVSVIMNAGREEYGKEEIIDLKEEFVAEFKGEPYSVDFGDIPQNARAVFNKIDFETKVLNNIKKNLCQHAFGGVSIDVVPLEDRLVRIRIDDENEYWLIRISNNGAEFPPNVDTQKVWSFGCSFGNQAAEDGGTGMYYLREAVEHFGGSVAFNRLTDGDFTVEYLLKLKKA